MPGLDVDLLLSVVKGLGSYVADGKGNRVYCKDDDCLRKIWIRRFLTLCDTASGQKQVNISPISLSWCAQLA